MKALKLVRSLSICMLAATALSGCYKISFNNGPVSTQQAFREGEWHHNGVFGLVEFSEPVDMKNRCDGKNWSTVKTHMTFIQGLVSGVTYSLYNPWDVAYSCK